MRQAEGIPDSGGSVQSPRSKRSAVCSRTVRHSIRLEYGGGREETGARGDQGLRRPRELWLGPEGGGWGTGGYEVVEGR